MINVVFLFQSQYKFVCEAILKVSHGKYWISMIIYQVLATHVSNIVTTLEFYITVFVLILLSTLPDVNGWTERILVG